MKTNKGIACATAAVLTLASLPILSVHAAETTYTLGDVDTDGILTGHDTAVISRALYEDSSQLSEEQIILADVNGDGVVDLTDLDWLHSQEEYAIGDIFREEDLPIYAAMAALIFDSYHSLGYDIKLTTGGNEKAILDEAKAFSRPQDTAPQSMDVVTYHLLDANGDGEVTIYDAASLLVANSRISVGYSSAYFMDNRYDLFSDYYNLDEKTGSIVIPVPQV